MEMTRTGRIIWDPLNESTQSLFAADISMVNHQMCCENAVVRVRYAGTGISVYLPVPVLYNSGTPPRLLPGRFVLVGEVTSRLKPA